MTLQRQTYLGYRNSTRSLTIFDISEPSHHFQEPLDAHIHTASTKSFILNLSDELLLPIVELACAPRKPDFPTYKQDPIYDNGTVRRLSSASKRFKRIAQPLLFRQIHFESPNALVPPSEKAIRLHRTLKKRKDLRGFCRSLHIYIPDNTIHDPDLGDYSKALDFADWLTKTRSLSIHGGFVTVHKKSKMDNPRIWALLRRMAANFKHLEQIDMSRGSCGLYLAPTVKWLAFPNLKSLKLRGMTEWKNHGDVELEVESKLHTASFNALHISDSMESPKATRLLLQWPTALTRFEFDNSYYNPHVMDYPMFEAWLFTHRDTLTHISIGHLSHCGSKRLFKATLFPRLEYLKLSRWQMYSPVHFSLDSSQSKNILGPALKTFAWNFWMNEQHSGGWCGFGDAEADWVRGLAETAVATKATLKMIKIEFTPEKSWGATEEIGYPWDRMDALRDVDLKPKGIGLVYNEPCVSKEAWSRFVRTGIYGSEDDHWNGVVDAGAEKELDGTERDGDEDEEVENPIRGDIPQGYHGEDIRGYFVKEAKVS